MPSPSSFTSSASSYASPRNSAASRRQALLSSPTAGGYSQTSSSPVGGLSMQEQTSLRWLQTSATRPKRHIAPERKGAGHYHHAHLEILDPNHAKRNYTMLISDMTKKDPEWLDDMPLFGASTAHFHDHPLTCEQEMAARRILCVLGYTCEMDFCPILLDLVPLLLMVLPEHVVYAVLRNMYLHRPFYFGTGHRYCLALVATFRDYMHKYFPETTAHMAVVGADTEEWLGAIFYRCFVPLVAHRDLVRLLDLYLEDGICFFFRFGLALFKETKWRLKAMVLESACLWWGQLADYTFSLDFDVEQGLQEILASYGSRVKRANLERLVALRMSDPVERELIVKQDIEPLQLILSAQDTDAINNSNNSSSSTPPLILHNKRTYLKLLASFIPLHQRQKRLSCIYSSDRHGRSLETLYRSCRKAYPCFLLIEELNHGHIIGAYCPEPIHPGKPISGTGATFIFRLTRPAIRYEWSKDPMRALEESDVFQLATPKFFAVGMSTDTDYPGLKIDAELEHGSSHHSKTFNNLPLCGRGQENFKIYRLEVYHLFTPSA